MGRWMSIDPIGLSGGTNVYAYCSGDPLNSADPSGLDEWYTWFGARWGDEPQWCEDLFPLWGSGKRAGYDFGRGAWGWGIVNTISFGSDFIAVGSLVKSVGKLGIKGTMAVGKMSWGTVRKQMGTVGLALAEQAFHHPIKQKHFGNSEVLKALLNQPFMVKPLNSAGYVFKGKKFTVQGFHGLLDGRTIHGVSMTTWERVLYGSNNFQKALVVSEAGRVGRMTNEVRIRF